MNLLFDFLRWLPVAERKKLNNLQTRGVMEQVWDAINRQVNKGEFNRDKILTEQSISSSHFDKITSELLARCYKHMFPQGGVPLLTYLSQQVGFIKHFYSELNRQVKHADKELSVEERKALYKTCLLLIHVNIPIIYRDEKVLKNIGAKYLALFEGDEKKQVKLIVDCRLLYAQMSTLFAAARIKEKESFFKKKIDGLGPLPVNANEEVVFEYYWIKMYLQHACEKFAVSYEIIKEAIAELKKFKSQANDINLLRLELKAAELEYFLSKFDESYATFNRIINARLIDKIPDKGYYVTKFIQIALITGNVRRAGEMLGDKLKNLDDGQMQLMVPRDIFSFIKYFLFNGQYEEAFKFIQLGFEKNPKGKYFQYEIELRNLQTAYFFLSGKQEVAVQGCARHIKYLRFHGYGQNKSDYPYFYVLTRAIFDKKTGGGDLTAKEKQMLERYQRGSYAIYGRLLLKMLDS